MEEVATPLRNIQQWIAGKRRAIDGIDWLAGTVAWCIRAEKRWTVRSTAGKRQHGDPNGGRNAQPIEPHRPQGQSARPQEVAPRAAT